MSNEEVGSGLMPNVYIDKITTSQTMSQLVCVPTVSVKERITMVPDPYIPYQFRIDYHGWKETIIETAGKIHFLIIASYVGNTQSSNYADQVIESINDGSLKPIDVDTQNYSNFQIIERSLSSITGAQMYKNKAEEDMQSLIYELESFDIDLLMLKNLVVYATTYIDLNNFSIDYNFGRLQQYVGYTKSEYIYKDSQKVTQAFYFINKNTGEIWPGPVHFHEGTGWMAGPRHTEENHPILTRVTLPNPKIVEL